MSGDPRLRSSSTAPFSTAPELLTEPLSDIAGDPWLRSSSTAPVLLTEPLSDIAGDPWLRSSSTATSFTSAQLHHSPRNLHNLGCLCFHWKRNICYKNWFIVQTFSWNWNYNLGYFTNDLLSLTQCLEIHDWDLSKLPLHLRPLYYWLNHSLI